LGEINQKRSGGDLMSKFNVNVNVLEVNNGDITKVEYKGIVFEKSAASIYRKVDRKAKVGDYLLFADGTASFITTGKYYEVVRVDSDGDAWVIDDDGDEFCNNYEIFEVYELISDEKVAEVKELEEKWAKIGRKPNEFKNGDIVRVKEDNANDSKHKADDVGEVSELRGDQFRVITAQNKMVNWVKAKHVELIAPVESRFDEAK
jgi:hypothetical protein